LSSLQEKIRDLVSGIDDPASRMEVARTIQLLFETFSTGQTSTEEIQEALVDVVHDTLAWIHPEMAEEELRNTSEKLADEFMRIFKATTGFRRVARRIGWTPL